MCKSRYETIVCNLKEVLAPVDPRYSVPTLREDRCGSFTKAGFRYYTVGVKATTALRPKGWAQACCVLRLQAPPLRCAGHGAHSSLCARHGRAEGYSAPQIRAPAVSPISHTPFC